MEADRWDQLALLFEEARTLPSTQRSSFLDEACGDDEALRAQLESLLAAGSEAQTYFKTLAGDVFAPAPVENTGDLPPRHIAHYEVLEKLGSGGMGVVYKARDTRLDRFVALKFLPPAFSADAEAKQRFIVEAKAASALDHVNICTIHEIGETADEQLFIAMAHYEGETLKKKIERGPLPVEEALNYATQIARGLEKAHARGIVHRDIKPANVIVTDDGVVKILDFGLAKMAHMHLTKTGMTMGTVAYMSPEQTRGVTVDHRTDVWSLGVVLYEMLTAEQPFRGEFDQVIIYSLMNEDPLPLTEINPEAPPDLEPLVALCLKKKRNLRYAAMADLLADLEVFVQGSGSRSSTVGFRARRRRGVPMRWRVMAALGGGLLLLLALALLIPASRQAMLTAMGGNAETYVAVLPFTSTIPEDQALADGLAQSVTSMMVHLEKAKHSLWVIPASEVVERGIKTAREARRILGATSVVRVSVQRIGATTQVMLILIDPNAEISRVLDSVTLPGPLDPTFQEKALTALSDLLDVRAGSLIREAAESSRPASPDAYAFYLRGKGYLQRFDKAGNIDIAIGLFRKAIEEDSLYALAHAGLCEAIWEQYRKTADTDLAAESREHCNHAATLVGEEAPVLVTHGSIFLRTGHHKEAEAVLRRALEVEPDNADAYRWLGRVYEEEGNSDQARHAYEQAIRLQPSWIYYNELGNFLLYAGRYQEAGRQFEQVNRLTPDNYLGYNNLAVTRRNQNQVEEAKRLFQHSIRLRPNFLTYRNLGKLYFRDQQYADAVRSLEQACTLNEGDWIAWSLLGHAYYWAGDSLQARTAWQRLIDLAEPKHELNPKDDDVLLLLTDAYVALGHRDQALNRLNLLLALPHNDVQTRYYIGRIYEMLGNRDLALDYLEEALVDHFDPVVPDQDPWLEALRQHARYQVLRIRFLESTD